MNNSPGYSGPERTGIVVVGAGVAGLMAASTLARQGHSVVVIDKGRGVGGRLSARRIGEATFDNGAQFMTARDERFKAIVDDWCQAGAASLWFGGDNDTSADLAGDRFPRWRGTPTMSALAKNLARDLNVFLQQRVIALKQDAGGWQVALASGATIHAEAVVVTPPLPQTLELFHACNLIIEPEVQQRLASIEYEPCLSLMLVLDKPTNIPSPGGFSPANVDEPSLPIAWIADNQQKGASAIPAVTIHATGEFSRQHWYMEKSKIRDMLVEAVSTYLGNANIIDWQIHGWLYSKPLQTQPDACLLALETPPLVLAGDAFAGPRVEGAALSGLAAANLLHDIFS